MLIVPQRSFFPSPAVFGGSAFPVYGLAEHTILDQAYNANFTIVSVIRAADINAPSSIEAGLKVKVRANIAAAYIEHVAGTSGDSAYNFATTPKQILFSGNQSVSSSNGTVSDIVDFTWDGSSNILIAVETAGEYIYSPVDTGNTLTYYSTVLEASSMSKSGYSPLSNRYILDAVFLRDYNSAVTRRIVCDGNSLTAASYGANYGGIYVEQLKSLLATEDVFNLGAGSATTAERASADATAGVFTPSAIAVLWEGTNDLYFNQDVNGAITRYVSWCNQVAAEGYTVVAATIIDRNNAYAGWADDAATFNSYVRAHYTEFSSKLADFQADTRLQNSNNTTYFNDGVHCTAKGYEVVATIAANIIKAL